MAHFAKLDEYGNVLAVHVINNEVMTIDGVEDENLGIEFLENLYDHSLWKQTSYNENFRKNYCSPGYRYDESKDAFIPPQPYPSWTLNEDTCRWEAPEEYPTDGKRYYWNENHKEWEEVV